MMASTKARIKVNWRGLSSGPRLLLVSKSDDATCLALLKEDECLTFTLYGIVEVEIFLMSPNARQNRNYFPDYIYYGASEQEAEQYESQFHIANRSNLSIENKFLADTFVFEQAVTQFTQRTILRDVQVIARELESLKQSQDDFTQDLTKLTRIMGAFLSQPMAPNTVSSLESEEHSQAEMDPPASGAHSDSGTLGYSTPATPATPVTPAPPYPLPSTAAGTLPQGRTAKKPLWSTGTRSSSRITTAIETESPAPFSPTSYFNSPQASTVTSPVASGSIPRPFPAATLDPELIGEPSSSSSSALPSKSAMLHRKKDLIDKERTPRSKSTQSSFKRRLPLKLAVVHTMDDALKAHRRLQDNNASHPVYVKPTSIRDADDDPLDDDDDEVDDAGSDEVEPRAQQLSRRLSEELSSQALDEELEHLRDPLRRAQTEILLANVPRDGGPFHTQPPNRDEDASSTADFEL